MKDQIAARERMQQYVQAAMADSRKIAEDISAKAQQRVAAITLRAEDIVRKQREQIADLEKKIDGINKSLNQDRQAAEPDYPPAMDLLSKPREFSLREPPQTDMVEAMAEIATETVESDPNSTIKREFSLRVPQEEYFGKDMLEQPTVDPIESDRPLSVNYEGSLQEPQELELEEIEPIPETEPEVFVPPLLTEETHDKDASLPAENPPEPDRGEELLQGDSVIRLDTTVEARHYHTGKDDCEIPHSHSWLIEVEIEMPPEQQGFVGYGKVSSIVTSSLARYDDVVLNEVFPFDEIEPNPGNMADYFFNCLEDNLKIMDLSLKEMLLSEDQEPIKKVYTRNQKVDELLQGEDILQEIREALNSRPDSIIGSQTLKGRLGRVFNKKQ